MYSSIDVTITAYKTWPASSESAEQAEAVLVATPVLITGFGEFEPSADAVVVADNFDAISVTIASEIISSFDAEYIIENVWRGRSGAGGGATNLSFTRDATSVTVTSDTGTDAQLPAANGTLAGVFTAAEQVKLAGISPGAQVNPTSAQIVAAIDSELGQVVWKQGSTEYAATAYGVVADGTTDDGPALRALVATVEAAGGGTIVLPAGTIKLSRGALATDGCVSLPSKVNLRGAGRDSTTIVTVDPVGGDIDGVIRTKNGVSVEDVRISDLAISPAAPSGGGGIRAITLHSGTNILVERVSVLATHAGTSNIGDAILVNTDDTVIRDTLLQTIDQNGILNSDFGRNGLLLDNVVIMNCGGDAISLEQFDQVRVRGCRIDSPADSGLQVADSNFIDISDTYFYQCSTGISMDTVSYATIQGWVELSYDWGISLNDCADCKVANSTIKNSSSAGNGAYPDIVLSGSTTRTLISGNIFLAQAANKANYAVFEATPSTADDNHITDNKTVGHTSGAYSLEGVNSSANGLLEVDAAAKAFIGCTYDTLDFSISSNGTTITASVEKEGTGAFTGIFSTGAYKFSTVPMTVALTAGTNAAPQINFVYILASNKTLTANTTGWPTAEHIPIGIVMAQSAAGAQSDGIFVATSWDSHVFDPADNGHVIHQNLWAHQHPPLWISGVAATANITTNGGSDDDIHISVTSGEILKLHKIAFPALDTGATASIYIANSSVAAFTKVGTLGTVLKTDAGGGVISNNRFANVVIWGSVSEIAGVSKIYANLPTGFYNNQSAALSDNKNYAVYSVPSGFCNCSFLIARLVFKYTTANGGTWQLVGAYDLRGQTIGVYHGGGNAAPVSTEFSDNTFLIYDDTDPTKIVAVEASGITSGQTRTMTVPDASGTLALLEVAQSFSAGAKKTFSHSATTAGMNVAPTAGDPSSPVDGDIWYNSTTNKFRKRQNGTTEDLDTQGSATPQGSDNQFQYNNGGVFGGASGLAYNETDSRPQVVNGLEIGKTGTANPGTNLVALRHVDEMSLLPRLRMTNTDGSIIHVGPTPVGVVQLGHWWAGAESATVNNGERLALSNHGSGTLNAYIPTNSSDYTKMLRVRASTSTSSNITAGLRSGVRWMMLDHGFYARMRFGISTPATGWSGFIGLANSAAALSGGSDPSSYTNILGFAWDTADTNLKFMHNDASGTATTVNLGSGYPTGNTDTDIYDVAIYVDPTDNATVYYSIERIIGGSGQTTNGSVTTDLPAVGTALGFQMFASNRSSAVAISFDLMGAYWETFF